MARTNGHRSAMVHAAEFRVRGGDADDATGSGRLNLLVAANAVLAVLAVAWFAVNLHGPRGPALLGWLPVTPSLIIAAVALWRTATSDGLPQPVRRFWKQMSAATLICAVGSVVAAHAALTVPRAPGSPEQIPMLALLLYLVTLLIAMWALLRIPLGSRSGSEWLRLGLDAATVLLAAALFIWYFAFSVALDMQGAQNSIWISLVLGSLSLVATAGMTKVVLAGAGPVDVTALRLLALGLLVGGLSAGLQPLIMPHPHLGTSQLAVPVISVFVAGAAERQGRGLRGPRRSGDGQTGQRRPFSLLPYAAVIATDALLLAVAVRYGDGKGLVVVVAAVILTGLVGVRQLAAFLDNARLLLRLREQEQRFRSLVQNASDITTILGAEGEITYVSPAVERVLGFSPDRWREGGGWKDVHPEDVAVAEARLAELRAAPGHSTTYQVRLRHVDGSWRWLEVTSTNLLDDLSVAGIVSNARDITEHHVLQQRLHHQASHDDLTKLANRSLFAERVRAAIERIGAAPVPEGVGPTVLLIDLDDFKAVNDTLGHAVGDALLVAVAGRLRQCIRSGDTVARLGGDEFAVLLHGLGKDSGVDVAERILASLAHPVRAHGHKLLVHASIGIVEGGPADDAGTLLRNADIAMYAAKERGKSRYACYSPGMDASILQHAELGGQLRQALDRGELHVVYQPVVTMPDARIVGAEALVRWRHPTRGLLLPAEFIATAEGTGLIVPLGRWMLREACCQAAAWRQAHGTRAPVSISVNVAARQLQEPGFVRDVADAIHDAGLEPHQLIIEVTERAAVEGGQVLQSLRELHGLGVRLALDDFGTGQSSLGLLRTCPVDILKLDKTFVDAIADPNPDAAVATAVILTARALGLDAVAEGVETPAQADRLWELGYRLVQGYHFARPLPPHDLSRLLAAPEFVTPGGAA